MSAFSSGFTTGQVSSIEDIARRIVVSDSSQGTVTAVTAGEGLCVAGGADSITNTGTINLDAGLSTLNDVNYVNNTPSNNQVLTWTGTSWQNQTFTNIININTINIADLDNVDLELSNDGQILKINNGEVTGVTDNYIETIVAGEGINRTVNVENKTVSIVFDPSNIIETTNHTGIDYIIIYNGTNTRRLLINELKTSTLDNDALFIGQNNLLVNDTLSRTIDTNNNTITLGVDQNNLPINFNTAGNITGQLAVANGGTGAANAITARTNLGLEYNVNILKREEPSFRKIMEGNNIIMMPKDYTFTLQNGGADYEELTGNTNVTFTEVGGDNDTFTTTTTAINMDVTNDGTITAPATFTLQDQTNSSHYNIQKTYTVQIDGQTGPDTAATYTVSPVPTYLSFGTSNTNLDNNIGFKSNNNVLQVKVSNDIGWTQIPVELKNLIDVDNTLSPSNNQILIYDGGVFKNAELEGGSNFNFSLSYSNQRAQLSLGINDDAINISKLNSTVTATQFNYLAEFNDSIKDQLDNKLGPPNTSITGDLLSYSGTAWGTFRNNGLTYAIIGVASNSTGLGYRHLYDYTVDDTADKDITDAGLVFVNNNAPASRISLNKFTDDLVKTNGGLSTTATDKRLIIDLDNLNEATTIDTDDLLLVHQDNETLPNKITKDNLFKSSTLPLKIYPTSGDLPANSPGHLAAYQTTSNGTSLAFHNGTDWYNIALGAQL